jgi:hypothetical protein
MKAPASLLGRGAIAGILAAATLVLWFLAVDLAEGQLFRTPAFLSRVLLGVGADGLGALGIALYTVVHFAVFMVVGVVTAWLARRLEVVPGALLGIVLGFALFELLFYGSLLSTGINVVYELGWPLVLVGNIIAGLVLFATLAALDGVEFLDWRATLAHHPTVREGLIAGLVGAVSVALLFMIIDLVAGRPLFTPAALGSALFLGANSTEAVQITPVIVLGYTALHLAAFFLTGLIASGIIAAAEETSEVIILGGVMLFFVFEVFSIGMMAMIWSWLVDVLSWWTIAAANLLAAVAMGLYLARRHRKLLYDLMHHDLEEELAQEHS